MAQGSKYEIIKLSLSVNITENHQSINTLKVYKSLNVITFKSIKLEGYYIKTLVS